MPDSDRFKVVEKSKAHKAEAMNSEAEPPLPQPTAPRPPNGMCVAAVDPTEPPKLSGKTRTHLWNEFELTVPLAENLGSDCYYEVPGGETGIRGAKKAFAGTGPLDCTVTEENDQ